MTPAVVAEFLGHVRQAFEQRLLVKLTLGDARGPDATLRNAYVRRVELRAGARLSFCFRHETRDVTRNFDADAGIAEIAAQLGTVFGSAHLFTTESETELRWPAGGEPRIRSHPARRAIPVSSSHDRTKSRWIEAGAPWLHALGVTTPGGQVRADMAAKFRQIHRFVEILGHCLAPLRMNLPSPQPSPVGRERVPEGRVREVSAGSWPTAPVPVIRLVDMGCGKGYLTFAAHEWLRRKGWTPEVVGLEARAELVGFCNRVAAEHAQGGLVFRQGTIAETKLESADILVALHACDTATDDAIAKGIQAGVRLILVAPCCHQELRPQLRAPPALAAAFRHGIFRERQAEFVTDALRAALLEWAGYETRVFEFIAADHTAKNVMIAATKREEGGDRAAREAAVRDLARAYGIRSQSLARRLGFALDASDAGGGQAATGSSATRH